MDYLGAVNRVLVNALILKGDDDLLTSFDDNQHEGTLRVAKNAIQTELDSILALLSIDSEKTTGTINTVAGTRTYSLPSDFIRFWGANPFFYLDTDDSQRLYEYRGGENYLRTYDYQYLTNGGYENWWYWDATNEKSVAFYQVPDDIRTWHFMYEKDISVVNSTDTIPFHNESESRAFADMASRRYEFMSNPNLDVNSLNSDNGYLTAQGTLMQLQRNRNPKGKYGKAYR